MKSLLIDVLQHVMHQIINTISKHMTAFSVLQLPSPGALFTANFVKFATRPSPEMIRIGREV